MATKKTDTRGRPRSPLARRIMIRLTDKEHDKIDGLAADRGISIAAWIREACRAYAGRRSRALHPEDS